MSHTHTHICTQMFPSLLTLNLTITTKCQTPSLTLNLNLNRMHRPLKFWGPVKVSSQLWCLTKNCPHDHRQTHACKKTLCDLAFEFPLHHWSHSSTHCEGMVTITLRGLLLFCSPCSFTLKKHNKHINDEEFLFTEPGNPSVHVWVSWYPE